MEKLSLEDIIRYVADKDISTHNKIIGLWLISGNKKEDFPFLPPFYTNVLIRTKNGKSYKAILGEYKNNPTGYKVKGYGKIVHIPIDEVISWVFI